MGPLSLSSAPPHGLAPPGFAPFGFAAEADDLTFCFTWARRLWLILLSLFGQPLVLLRFFTVPLSVCTHFSGLGTVELALDMLAVQGTAILRAPFQVHAAYACDSSPSNQAVLRKRLRGGCVFNDIFDPLGGIEPDGFCCNDDAGRRVLCFDKAKNAIMRAPVLAVARCVAHKGPCAPKPADMDVSGSPCTPWSRASHRTPLRRRHPAVAATLAWCKVLRERRVKIALHENVRGVDVSFFVEVLGDEYNIVVIYTSPADASFSLIRRPRAYMLLTRKDCVRVTADIQAMHARVSEALRCKERRSAGPACAWRATESELLAEENGTHC